MNYEVEISLTSRTVQVHTDSAAVALAYGRYSEDASDENWERLLDVMEPYIDEALEYEAHEIRRGHQERKRPWLTREEGE